MKYSLSNIFSTITFAKIKPGLYHGFAALVDRAAFFLVFVLVGRFFGEAEIGKLSTALNLANILQVISDLGLPVLIQRESSKRKDVSTTIALGCILKLIFSFVLYVFILLYVNKLNVFSIYYLTLIYCAIIIFGITNFFLVYLIGVNKNREYFSYQALTRIVMIALALFVIKLNEPAFVPYVLLFAALLQLFILFSKHYNLLIKGFSNLRKKKEGFSLIKQSGAIWLGLLFVFAYDKIDILIITYFRGTNESGIYYSAYSIMRSVIIFTSFYLTYYFTLFSSSYNTRKIQYKIYIRQSLVISIVLSLILISIINLFSEKILTLFYGKLFEDNADIFRIVSFSIIFIVLNYNLGTIFNSMKLIKIPMWGGAIAFIFNLCLNIIFVPEYGYRASAYVTISTELIMFCFLGVNFYYKIFRKLKVKYA